MREIKFRFWDKVDKKMRYPAHSFPDVDFLYFEELERSEWGDEEFENLQYTGVKDANGTEIYEGDILKHKDGLCEVKNGICDFQGGGRWNGFYTDGLYHGRYPLTNGDVYEVVGNIYENPEVLSKLKEYVIWKVK